MGEGGRELQVGSPVDLPVGGRDFGQSGAVVADRILDQSNFVIELTKVELGLPEPPRALGSAIPLCSIFWASLR